MTARDDTVTFRGEEPDTPPPSAMRSDSTGAEGQLPGRWTPGLSDERRQIGIIPGTFGHGGDSSKHETRSHTDSHGSAGSSPVAAQPRCEDRGTDSEDGHRQRQTAKTRPPGPSHYERHTSRITNRARTLSTDETKRTLTINYINH